MDNQSGNGAQDKSNQDNGGGDNRQAQLAQLKKQALDVLVPVVDKIDQPPERKFEILMTAARSSGDAGLLAKTLEAAQRIGNDNQKADALLDVLNEINYNLRDN